jgi:two-component system OmpR family response regulator
MTHILVVEDDELLRDAVVAQLEKAGYAVVPAVSVHTALEAIAAHTVNAAVLDLGLPDGNGLDLLDRLRQHTPGLPVMLLTARDGIEDRIAGLKRGADDYVSKPFHMSEFQARVFSMLRRARLPAFEPGGPAGGGGNGTAELHQSQRQPSLHALRMDKELPRAWVGERAIELTQREWELLSLLVDQTEGVVGREDVMAAWQASPGEAMQSNALEVYIHRVRRKISDTGWRIRNVRGLGYMLEPEHKDGA